MQGDAFDAWETEQLRMEGDPTQMREQADAANKNSNEQTKSEGRSHGHVTSSAKGQNICSYSRCGGHAIAQWLRHYATSRKVAGSRSDEAN
jgi:hypothetical protein